MRFANRGVGGGSRKWLIALQGAHTPPKNPLLVRGLEHTLLIFSYGSSANFVFTAFLEVR
jgi:hypothetical protein